MAEYTKIGVKPLCHLPDNGVCDVMTAYAILISDLV